MIETEISLGWRGERASSELSRNTTGTIIPFAEVENFYHISAIS